MQEHFTDDTKSALVTDWFDSFPSHCTLPSFSAVVCECWNFRSQQLSLPQAKVLESESFCYRFNTVLSFPFSFRIFIWIGLIIGSDRRPETKQGIEGKLIGSDREGLG